MHSFVSLNLEAVEFTVIMLQVLKLYGVLPTLFSGNKA